jgi:hypothetical protein
MEHLRARTVATSSVKGLHDTLSVGMGLGEIERLHLMVQSLAVFSALVQAFARVW